MKYQMISLSCGLRLQRVICDDSVRPRRFFFLPLASRERRRVRLKRPCTQGQRSFELARASWCSRACCTTLPLASSVYWMKPTTHTPNTDNVVCFGHCTATDSSSVAINVVDKPFKKNTHSTVRSYHTHCVQRHMSGIQQSSHRLEVNTRW